MRITLVKPRVRPVLTNLQLVGVRRLGVDLALGIQTALELLRGAKRKGYGSDSLLPVGRAWASRSRDHLKVHVRGRYLALQLFLRLLLLSFHDKPLLWSEKERQCLSPLPLWIPTLGMKELKLLLQWRSSRPSTD